MTIGWSSALRTMGGSVVAARLSSSSSTTSRCTPRSGSTASPRSSSTMPSATRSSSGSGSPPSRSPAASSRTSRRWTAAPLVVLLLCLLTGCNSHQADGLRPAPRRISAEQARTLEQRVLDQRARAIRQHDPSCSCATSTTPTRRLMARQRRYYRNLAQLPLAAFRYQVRAAQWVGQQLLSRWGNDVRIPQVTLSSSSRGTTSSRCSARSGSPSPSTTARPRSSRTAPRAACRSSSATRSRGT